MEKMQFHFVPVVLEGRIYNQTNNSREMLESFNNRKDFYYEIYPDNNRFSNTISKNEPYNKLEFLSVYCGCTWGYKGNPYLSTGCESKFWLLIFIFNLQKKSNLHLLYDDYSFLKGQFTNWFLIYTGRFKPYISCSAYGKRLS